MEFDRGHIENALNIPVDELEQRLDELDPVVEILVYCRSGLRSSRAMKILTENGFSRTYNMEGGIEAWKRFGHSVTGCIPCGG